MVAASTKSPPRRTGRATVGCYAAPLADCDGELTAEHYVSKNLLEQFGKAFTIKGPPWAPDGKRVSAKSLTAKVLCRRHNNALSDTDKIAGQFYPLILAAIQGQTVGAHEFDGAALERWALKLMFAVGASGNVSYPDIGKVNAQEIPVEHLEVLFGQRDLPSGCGFKFSQTPGLGVNTALAWQLNIFSDGPEAGQVFGITIKVANWFQFITTLRPVTELNGVYLYHRPGGFVLLGPRGELGHIKLRWPDKTYDGSLILRLRSDAMR